MLRLFRERMRNAVRQAPGLSQQQGNNEKQTEDYQATHALDSIKNDLFAGRAVVSGSGTHFLGIGAFFTGMGAA